MKSARLFLLTSAAMIAFASNSILCRLALKQTNIDAASFTFVRIFSGALTLWLILQMRSKLKVERVPPTGDWPSAFALFAYAIAFSFAYLDLPAGTGALLLFGAVQATMILWGFFKGERLDLIQLAGLVVAIAGLVVLVFPGISAPPLTGSILMLGSGVAWGVYSIRGKVKRHSEFDSDPIAATAGNFLRAVPFAFLISLIMANRMHFDSLGVFYAILSGALTSGLGYVIWYAVLPEMKATSAATVQLSVPVLAATAGIIFLSEPITVRYLIASVAVLGGIALVVLEKRQQS